MNPITATTLRIENAYSASPKVLTLQKLIATMTTKKKVMLTHSGMGEDQNCSVIDAAMISNGKVTSHCRA